MPKPMEDVTVVLSRLKEYINTMGFEDVVITTHKEKKELFVVAPEGLRSSLRQVIPTGLFNNYKVETLYLPKLVWAS